LSDSERLTLNGVRRVFRLIGELREVGSDPQRWRPHLIGRLRKIIPADMIVSSEVHFRTTDKPGVLQCTDIGWGGAEGADPWSIHTEREENPETYLLAIGKPPAATATTDTSKTDRSRGREPAGPAPNKLVPVAPTTKLRGGKAFILSQYPLAHLGAVDQLGLHRYSLDNPFTHAEHKLVRLFHVELGRLWRTDALRNAEDPMSELPPRLAQTLEQLVKGDSEKQIAYELDLSQHTIHNYIKALHRRFAVSSRAELLSKAMSEGSDFRPKLSVTIPRRAGRKAKGTRGGAIPKT
jgi:DNA-binding CsgD family transcriptional regulator